MDRVPSGGETPWSFKVDPTGSFLLATDQASENVTAFRIDARTGKLAPTGEAVKVPAPSCAVFVQV